MKGLHILGMVGDQQAALLGQGCTMKGEVKLLAIPFFETLENLFFNFSKINICNLYIYIKYTIKILKLFGQEEN